MLVVVAALVSAQLASIRSGWEIVLEVGAGTGGVYLLRWYWWRINAWSEISAMATALVSSLTLRWWAPFAGNPAGDLCQDRTGHHGDHNTGLAARDLSDAARA